MKKSSAPKLASPFPVWEQLEAFARSKIQEWLQHILEEEVSSLLGREKGERLAAVDAEAGYRNGHGKPRRLAMQGGTITVRRPRVRGLEERFESRILPLFKRRTEEVAELLPQLYLHGLSQGDFDLALRGLLGEGAPLSPSSIERLRAKWELELEAWSKRRLDDRQVVYSWADGIYVKAGLEREKLALLVVIGAMTDGRKEILALVPGYRESHESWRGVLRDLRDRGLRAPRVLVADGIPGLWTAAAEVWPETLGQRCWNHKIMNVLDKVPKKVQAEARELLRDIPYAPTRDEAEERRDDFVRRYGRDYERATDCLVKDWDDLVRYYAFPTQHWIHLRTSNIVESPFAAVRIRTNAAKRYKKGTSATAVIYKILMVGQTKFRRLNAPELLPHVYTGAIFKDGKLVNQSKELEDKVAA